MAYFLPEKKARTNGDSVDTDISFSEENNENCLYSPSKTFKVTCVDIPTDHESSFLSETLERSSAWDIPTDTSSRADSIPGIVSIDIPSVDTSTAGEISPIKTSSQQGICSTRDVEILDIPTDSSFDDSVASASGHSTSLHFPSPEQAPSGRLATSTPIKNRYSDQTVNFSTLDSIGNREEHRTSQGRDQYTCSESENFSNSASPGAISINSNHSISIQEAKFSFECCQKLCTRSLGYDDLLIARKRFNGISTSGQYQWLLNYLWDHTKKNKESDDEVIYCIAGTDICQVAWLATLGVKASMIKKVHAMFTSGVVLIENKRQRSSSRKRSIAFAWMGSYFNKIGDKVPDGVGINLPSYLTFRSLYQFMKKDLVEVQSEMPTEIISYTLFTCMMKDDFPDVRIPVVNRFTKCDVCTVLKEEKEKTIDETLRNYIDKLLTVHNNTQKNERTTYYKHRQKAKDVDRKQNYLCIIIDGMDQEKLLIPRLINVAKSYSNAWRLRTHLTGVINHGREILSFVDIFQWPHDSNYTLNILVKTIARLETIPDVLYLQMDNCFRENKNQFLLNFLGILVKMGIFKKVKLNFLMVGHTHEDVDQLFSKIGSHLRRNNIRTLDELMTGVKNAYTPEPEVEFVDNMYDISTWMSETTTELHNITKPHCFVINKAENGNVVLRYKNWSNDDNWLPSKKPEECIVLVEADKEINEVPPDPLQPSSDKIDLARLKSDIGKFIRNSAVFEEEHKNWWDEFLLHKVEVIFGHKETPVTWPLDVIKMKKQAQRIRLAVGETPETPETRPVLDDNPNSLASVPAPTTVPERVSALVDKHSAELPQVYTGRYLRPQALASMVTQVEDHLDALKEGVFVAIAQAGSKPPIIGKVLEVGDETFKIAYWKGTWRKPWAPWLLGTPPSPWEDDLPKSCILLTDFQLNEKAKIPHLTYKYLKSQYDKL